MCGYDGMVPGIRMAWSTDGTPAAISVFFNNSSVTSLHVRQTFRLVFQ
jgi:hypothetical protein